MFNQSVPDSGRQWKARCLPLLLLMLACPLFAGDFLPLATGNSWTYRSASSADDSLTVRVGSPVSAAGQVYFMLAGYVDQELLVRINEAGDLVYLDEERNFEFPLTMFNPTAFAFWNAPFRTCDQLGQARERRGTHNSAAGNWSNVLEIQYRNLSCADTGIEVEQFAENIGMLRRTVSTIAGPRDYNLVHARIGQQVLEADAKGRFTVSVLPEEFAVRITLRVDVAAEPGLKLQFPSSQEYDAVLRDPLGQVIWTWSNDQVFTQSLHDRILSAEWTVSLQAPFPPSTALPGAYTVEAWLTIAEGSPRLAAATSFTVN